MKWDFRHSPHSSHPSRSTRKHHSSARAHSLFSPTQTRAGLTPTDPTPPSLKALALAQCVWYKTCGSMNPGTVCGRCTPVRGRAFTLIELLVVIAIIAILAALLL